jgi:UPF0716 family protein affecting phage T7 exclusion
MAAPSSLDAAVQEIGALQSHLPGPVSAAVGVAALVAAALPLFWQMTTHVNTIAHEGAHAIVGSAIGGRVTSVTMDSQGRGETALQGLRRPGNVLFLLVGYLGPSGFGLVAAELIHLGHIVAVLWLTLFFLVLLLIPLRSIFSVVAVLATMLALYLVARYATVGLQVAAAYGLAWFLLLSGLRAAAEEGETADDAKTLKKLTRMPTSFWSGFWLIGSALALAFGGLLLL